MLTFFANNAPMFVNHFFSGNPKETSEGITDFKQYWVQLTAPPGQGHKKIILEIRRRPKFHSIDNLLLFLAEN